MNIVTILQVYCLPDGYEVEDRSLEVIRYVLNPTFKHEEVRCSPETTFYLLHLTPASHGMHAVVDTDVLLSPMRSNHCDIPF